MSIGALQYVGLFAVWIATLISAAICLASRGWRGNGYVVGVMWACVWYLTIQTHWVINVASSVDNAVEWWWSLFETLVGVLLYCSLPSHRCGARLPDFLRRKPEVYTSEQRSAQPAP